MNAPDGTPTDTAPTTDTKSASVASAQLATAQMARPGVWSSVRGVAALLWATVLAFVGDDCASMAAALSFYTFFSLPALLTLVLSLVGRVTDPARVQHAIVVQASGLIGPSGADQVTAIIGNAHLGKSSAMVATVLSIIALGFGATTSFAQLQAALNRVWSVKVDPRQNQVLTFIRKRILSFGLVIVLAFLLTISLAVSTTLVALGGRVAHGAMPPFLAHVLTTVLGFVVIAALFSMMYRYLPDARIAWRDVRAGAIASALLFTVGKTVIGAYLGSTNPGNVYGAAGSLAVILIWVYYTSMVVLLGAEFTRLWAQRYGRGIVPQDGAIAYVEEERQVRS